MKRIIVVAATLVFVFGAAGYTLAQMGGTQGGMMGSGTMGRDGAMEQSGQGVAMGGWMMSMMHGQPLTQEQLDQFAQRHGMTIEQAKQMTDACTQAVQAPGNDEPAQ